MSRRVRSEGLRTGENRSFRPVALVTIIAMLGFAGYVLAGSANNRGAKVAPIVNDTRAQKASASAVTADRESGEAPALDSGALPANSPQAVPANDDCAGAIVIPAGSYPIVSAPVDITEATPQGSDDAVVACATTDQTVWFSFTPTVTGNYIFSTCAGNGATGSTVYDTVLAVLDSTGGACPQGAPLGCNDTAAACVAAVPGAPYVDQSTAAAVLVAGNTYFVVAGHWSGDAGGVTPGLNEIAIEVDISAAPDNDTCSAPTPLALNRVTRGSTAGANNDYRSDGTPTCFSGLGQTPTTSAGVDVVFSFTAPADGTYSFRYVQDDSAAALRGQNPALYLSGECPASAPNGPAVSCIKGANRIATNGAANGNRSEEIDCVPLTAGQLVYLYFDDRNAGNAGGPLAVEVTACHAETEPNDDVATANPVPGCFATGAAATVGDVDFYDLGAPPAGAKIFAGIDAVAANDGDFELRVTNATDTLGYDDNDGTSQTSSNAPIVAGVVADGSQTYVRVNKGSAAAQLAASEPYHLYTRIETGVAQAEVDNPSNASYYYGNLVTGGGFVSGVHASATDQDCFRFVAKEGDNIAMFSDNNPSRVGGTIVNTWPILRDVVLGPPTATRFTGQVLRNIVTPSPGTLTGVTPSVTSEFWDYRARYSGTYMVCFYPDAPAAGYPLPYQGSISLNCGPIPAPSSLTTDVAVTKTGPTGPVNTGSPIDYTITLTNTGSDIAVDARLADTLPPELVFLGLSVDDGFSGNNVGCLSLPTPGTSDAPIDCTVFSIAPGASVTYTLSVQVANCIGAGVAISNTASITTVSTDPNPANDAATAGFTTSQDGTCADLLCDAIGCIPDGCTINDHCDGAVCVSDALNCDDNSLCTADACDPVVGCINDSSQLGDLCNDGNVCTGDSCDPLLFCVFPPASAGLACDDFLNCTTPDQCDGLGNCVGLSVCDDGNQCTDDFADEGNSCACTNDPSFPGTLCNDNSACTVGDVCDGLGTMTSCNGGIALNCDDGNPCTDDSCDPATGCVHANNTGACTDGNACTTGDACGGGACQPGTAVVCNDGNGCTTDSCNPASGCVVTNNTNACNDGNACTQSDVCSAGACVGSNPVVCTASDSCHLAGVCDSGTGVCSNPAKPSGSACDDGDACTTSDTCSNAGACVAGTAAICADDGDACTANVCDPASGCVAPLTNLDVGTFSASRVDGRDLEVLALAWNSCPTDLLYNPAANLDQRACVDLTDFHLFMNAFGRSCL